jgi:hypothetical protein
MHFQKWKRREFITLLGGSAPVILVTARGLARLAPYCSSAIVGE